MRSCRPYYLLVQKTSIVGAIGRGIVASFPLSILMVHSPKPIIVANDNNLTGMGFTLGETIYYGRLEFNADHFVDLTLSPEGNDSGTIFMGMVPSASPSQHTILEESIDEDDTTSNGMGSSGLPISQGCNAVTPTAPITTTSPLENTPVLLTIPTVPLRTAIPQPYTWHPLDQLEEQQARAHARLANAERRASHRQGELTGKRAAIEYQLSELHHRKSTFETLWVVTVDLTKA
jgi:hypothetical protein